MKKIFLIVLASLLLAATAFAGGPLKFSITKETASLVLVTAGSCEMVQLTALCDGDENTAAARVWHVYDSATTAGAGTATFYFSITKTAGSFFDGDLYKGFVSQSWGGPSADGIEFSNGIVISPTAGTKASFIVNYR